MSGLAGQVWGLEFTLSVMRNLALRSLWRVLSKGVAGSDLCFYELLSDCCVENGQSAARVGRSRKRVYRKLVRDVGAWTGWS